MQAGLREGTGAHGIEAVEMWLFKQLQEIAPGKYVLASYLERVKPTLRFPCTHLKGGKYLRTGQKDWNLSFFRFATGISEIKCLYGCGLKLRSDEGDKDAWTELHGLFQNSTNTTAASEINAKRNDPGPVPTYTDAARARIQERENGFWKWAKANPEEYRERFGNVDYNHPDPKEAPESIIPRQMEAALANVKSRPPVLKATVTFQDSIPVADGVDPLLDYARDVTEGRIVQSVEKIKKALKARKTQSRKSRKK